MEDSMVIIAVVQDSDVAGEIQSVLEGALGELPDNNTCVTTTTTTTVAPEDTTTTTTLVP
jgi:hypothetical protein